MKIKEWRHIDAGFSGYWQARVRTLEEGEAMPHDAVEVPAETPEHDWQRTESAPSGVGGFRVG